MLIRRGGRRSCRVDGRAEFLLHPRQALLSHWASFQDNSVQHHEGETFSSAAHSQHGRKATVAFRSTGRFRTGLGMFALLILHIYSLHHTHIYRYINFGQALTIFQEEISHRGNSGK